MGEDYKTPLSPAQVIEKILDNPGNGRGNGKLKLERYFTKTKDPYDEINWKTSNIDIKNDDGEVIFTQKDFKHPEFYSLLANQVIASRYVYGEKDTAERENSVADLVQRVSKTYGSWALKQGYMDQESSEILRDKIAWLCLNQHMSFNSPVWFNVGTEKYPSKIRPNKGGGYSLDLKTGQTFLIAEGEGHKYPQTSACFIQSLEDTMESIMTLPYYEAMLFKNGSGTGTDLSTLRSSKEKLSGGGNPSGPMAYEIFFDDVAGIVKSGGKTRRAAKMNSLKISHPDIYEFIIAKQREQEKIRILIGGEIPKREAIESVHYQNTNFSVRVNNDFMMAVKNGEKWKTIPVHNTELADEMPEYDAKELFRLIAEGTHSCGDPGMQFEDEINKWHTCPNSGKINASNPCSEYMFLDDSACNLASINLMRFKKEKGGLDIPKLRETIETMVISTDLNIDNSSYPTQSIAENAHKFRPLGIGYSNLGSYLMTSGIPYDSDEGRATVASITALLAGEVYRASSNLAEKLGAFEEFEKNREPMLDKMKMHRDALDDIDVDKISKENQEIYTASRSAWDETVIRGEKYGFRNAQGTVLAPTGTISFMMDCDTTGIEPDTALIKYKQLSEGGLLKIVNTGVDPALETLGYDSEQRKKILDYLNEHETIEGAPELKDEHLSVFDCALKTDKGERYLSWKSHVDMMAVAQPFLSGAISKTINMPKEATVEDIANAYRYGWEKGLKSMAIYRDGSKALQPLITGKKSGIEEKVSEKKAIRTRLPNTRDSRTHKFSIAGGGVEDADGNMIPVNYEGYITIGFFEDGRPGELFLTMSKEGSLVGGLMDSIGTLSSVCLQYGAPLEVLRDKFQNSKFEPRGLVHEGLPEIKVANSLVEYIFDAANIISKQYVRDKQLISLILNKSDSLGDDEKKEIISRFHPVFEVSNDENESKNNNGIEAGELGKMCPNGCGPMIPKGHCSQVCPKCNVIDYAGCGG